MQLFMTKEFLGLTATTQLIFSEGDKVVILLEYHGTHAKYKHEVIWREAWISLLSEGKIAESWPVIDDSSYLRQLGYHLKPPDT